MKQFFYVIIYIKWFSFLAHPVNGSIDAGS